MNELSLHVIGALAALGSAFCWALSAILFHQVGDKLSATGMNWWKGLVALLLLTILLLPDLPVFSLDEAYWRLAASGLLGIFIGDTLYFLALTRLGARVTLLVGTMIPVVTAIGSVILFGDTLPLNAWLGLGLTLLGVTWVLWTQASTVSKVRQWRQGLFYGALFVLANAAAIIMTKQGVESMDADAATWIRTFWAVFALGLFGTFTGRLLGWTQPLRSAQLRKRLLAAAVIGALLGTWLSVVALKFTYASVAAALNSTSPIFVLPLVVIFFRERIDFTALFGAFLAVVGVGVYFASVFG